jgi:hypothetical protein
MGKGYLAEWRGWTENRTGKCVAVSYLYSARAPHHSHFIGIRQAHDNIADVDAIRTICCGVQPSVHPKRIAGAFCCVVILDRSSWAP